MWRRWRRQVWSDYGGRGRSVTLEGPDRLPGSATQWGRKPRWPAFGYGAGVVILGGIQLAAWPALPVDVDAWPLYLLATLGTVAWLVLAVQFVRLLQDIAAPTTIEGKVIVHQYIEGHDGGEGPSEPDVCRIAVDDGRANTARIYNIDGRTFAHLVSGDIIRLTVGPNHGHVQRVEMLSSGDGAGQVGSIPEAPDAPLSAPEMSRALGRVVRAIHGPETNGSVVPVRTWTYHLGGDDTGTVRVHLAEGHDGIQVLIGMVNRSGRRREEIARVGDKAWRFGTLVIATKGDRVVGVEPTDQTLVYSGDVDKLARLALDSG